MLLDLLAPLVILSDNVLVTLDTQEPHVINVLRPTIAQAVFVEVRNSSYKVVNFDCQTKALLFSLWL